MALRGGGQPPQFTTKQFSLPALSRIVRLSQQNQFPHEQPPRGEYIPCTRDRGLGVFREDNDDEEGTYISEIAICDVCVGGCSSGSRWADLQRKHRLRAAAVPHQWRLAKRSDLHAQNHKLPVRWRRYIERPGHNLRIQNAARYS